MSQIACFCHDIKPLRIPFLIDRMEILFNWSVEEKKNKEGKNKKSYRNRDNNMPGIEGAFAFMCTGAR